VTALVADVAGVRVPVRTWRFELRAARVVCRRELIRFAGNRGALMAGLVQPLLFLFVLGTGLEGQAAGSGDVGLRTLLFPGVIAMAALFAGMVNALSLVWDRELGFLQELLVAPVGRTSILAGKVLGGALIAAGQGVIVLALAGLADVPYHPVLLLGLFGMLVLTALTVSAFGVMVAVRIRHAQTFSAVMQLLVLPASFLSGALFPVSGLPAWLEVLNRLDPLTYAVDPMRRLVLDHAGGAPANAGVTWWGWHLPVWFEVAVVAAMGLGFLAVAVRRFSRAE